MPYCVETTCKIRAYFGFENEEALYCKKHSKLDMVDLLSKRCIIKDCTKQCFYNLITETEPEFCGLHKTKEMVNVKTGKCKIKDKICNKIPSFNYANFKTPLAEALRALVIDL